MAPQVSDRQDLVFTVPPDRPDSMGFHHVSDALEQGRVVVFPTCPIPLPDEQDLEFLRGEMPRHLRRKNVSYHPEADRLVGIKARREIVERTHRILKEHHGRVREFLRGIIPSLAAGWKVGTSSFRPLEEKGRKISAHASSELIHVDARAYGATHGDRILRFFVNVHPAEERIWETRGTFAELYRRYAREAGIAPPSPGGHDLREGLADRAWTGFCRALSSIGLPMAGLLDNSPYDRLMRRFHNYMKDTPSFQQSPDGRARLAFKPRMAWMVFTDGLSHACVSGRHAFIDTFIVPIGNSRLPQLSPWRILQQPVD